MPELTYYETLKSLEEQLDQMKKDVQNDRSRQRESIEKNYAMDHGRLTEARDEARQAGDTDKALQYNGKLSELDEKREGWLEALDRTSKAQEKVVEQQQAGLNREAERHRAEQDALNRQTQDQPLQEQMRQSKELEQRQKAELEERFRQHERALGR